MAVVGFGRWVGGRAVIDWGSNTWGARFLEGDPGRGCGAFVTTVGEVHSLVTTEAEGNSSK